MPCNDLTNLNFTSSRVQGTHDNEAGTSSRRRINHTTSETPTLNVFSDTTPNDATSYYNQGKLEHNDIFHLELSKRAGPYGPARLARINIGLGPKILSPNFNRAFQPGP
ncbi:hypothetical protein MTR_3g091890 [Medicago truncatula]|uniref:Uncharacterized protein n=1 Tax=Medicago truncatula TaxID=3880 RepID=G7J7I1_MEDTR|nr:hypothetical protein MTR_3g091890 [Medicago truncatula]